MKKTLSSLKIAVLAAVVCAACSTASAQLIITQSPDAPTENVYKHNTLSASPGNVTAYKRKEKPDGKYYEQQIGQGFNTVGETTDLQLTSVTFKVQHFDNTIPEGIEVSISIYQGAGAQTNPLNSTLLSKQVGNLPSVVKVDEYITFTFAQPVTLAPDAYYSVIFAFEDYTNTGSTAAAIGFYTIASGSPGVPNSELGLNARRWIGNDGAWNASTSNGFYTYIGASIPEPSTYALMGGVAALLTVLALRRRK